jgi:hypothetical protein
MAKSQLKVGVDVPWVTSWSGERVLGVGPCASIEDQLAVLQFEAPGEGKPQYSMNHYRRQRVTVGGMLCPMCGEPTSPDDRWTQVARRTDAGALRARGFGPALPPGLPDKAVVVDAGAIAPLHAECSRRSLLYCPHLRGHAEVEVRRFPERWVIAPLYVEVKPPAKAPGRAPASIAAVTFLQLLGLE